MIELEIHKEFHGYPSRCGILFIKGKKIIGFTPYPNASRDKYLMLTGKQHLSIDFQGEYSYMIYGRHDPQNSRMTITIEGITFLCSPNLFQCEYLRYYHQDRWVYTNAFKISFLISIILLTLATL